MTGLAPAWISLGGVVVGALLAALFALQREKLARRQQRQVQALYELQDSCLAHRQAWQDFAAVQACGVDQDVIRATERTAARLEVVLARVRSAQVRERALHWRTLVKPALLMDDRRPVSPEAENQAWLQVQEAVREQLGRLG